MGSVQQALRRAVAYGGLASEGSLLIRCQRQHCGLQGQRASAQSSAQAAAIRVRGYATVSPDEARPAGASTSAAAAIKTAVRLPPLSAVFGHAGILTSPPPPTAPRLEQQQTANTAAHPSIYATVLIHGKPYLVTPGDRLRLPFRMPGVRPGDVLRLDRVGVLGSRNVTAMAAGPTAAAATDAENEGGSTATKVAADGLPNTSVMAVVLGVETEPMRLLIKTKRRQRRKRTVKSKHYFTVLRIQEVVVEEAKVEAEA